MPSYERLTIDPFITNFFLMFILICAGTFGIIGDIFNICNFSNQGIDNSVTVTLVSLALIELGALVTLQGYNMVSMPWISVGGGDIDPSALFFIFFYLNGYFIRVSGLITVCATFERCVLVFWPFKAKLIFTRNMAASVNLIIYIVLLLYLLPPFYVFQVEYHFSPQFKKSIFFASVRSNAENLLQMMHSFFILIDIVSSYLIFLFNILCTSFIIRHLKTQAKWRKSVTRSFKKDYKEHSARKEKRVMVMLVTLSVVFVACLLPHCVVLTVFSVLEIIDGDLVPVTYSLTFLLETINCSVSCIIYYKMSSKYREVATKMLAAFKNFM
ncbi:psychosine receptor [Biomphalaria pfeifferi]|uniref:Psychosine receptor n=1 Tax=Biomphalaria pfeifferi TaxID=112525 RepID=A0AAD8B0F9_BIOPF|nr:psychosine receptor [Biomphalaria pfeifferi]